MESTGKRRVVDLDSAIDSSIRKLGYEKLKEHQRRVVQAFTEGNDVFAVLPTGYGKSLCYFCLPYLYDILDDRDPTTTWSVILVISPLNALMDDQVRTLTGKGVHAVVYMLLSSLRLSFYSQTRNGPMSFVALLLFNVLSVLS